MPTRAKKEIPAREAVVAHPSSSVPASDSEVTDDSDSDDVSEGEDDGGGLSESEEESDSDALDSSAPRKRRRISPEPDDENEEEKEAVPTAPVTFSAPSRIKRKTASNENQPALQPSNKVTTPPPELFEAATTAPTDPNTTFESLGVHPWLVRSLTNMAIRRPTGIQKGCIPEILKGRDCIGGSRTGSGKTVAFAVPILQRWAEDPSAIFAVVMTPTR